MVALKSNQRPRSRRGGLATIEMLFAMSLLVFTVMPLSYSFYREDQLCRAYYQRAIAMEIVDGEMEALVAGEWRSFKPGQQPYTVRAGAVRNLPVGKFVLTIEEARLRLEWIPEGRDQGGRVMRQASLKQN